MTERARGATAAAFENELPPGVPGAVRAAFLLWLAAVGAGVVETVVRVVHSFAESSMDGVASGILVRVVVYTAVVYVTFRMRRGKRWARLTLAVVLGVVGTLSLVIDPVSWLAAGNSLRDAFIEADLLFAFVAPIRAVHLAAVIAALVFMFSPPANEYFRSTPRK